MGLRSTLKLRPWGLRSPTRPSRRSIRALEGFARIAQRQAQAVELHYFGGLSVRDMDFAKAWRARELGRQPGASPHPPFPASSPTYLISPQSFPVLPKPSNQPLALTLDQHGNRTSNTSQSPERAQKRRVPGILLLIQPATETQENSLEDDDFKPKPIPRPASEQDLSRHE